MSIQPDVILMPYQMFVELQKDPKFQEIYNGIITKYKDKIIFLAMDHLFFPITIKNKLVAFKRFLSANAERANKVVFLLIVRDEIKGDTKVPESMEKIIKEIKDEFYATEYHR